MAASTRAYDAVLLVGFGGPTKMEEVRPFIENVLRGRSAAPDRIDLVVQHYADIGGRSPFNALTFRQAQALESALRAAQLPLRVYVGMRNWTPYLHETLARMADTGVRRAVGVIMAAQQNDASWDRYQRDVAAARARVGASAPAVDFAAEWHAHPLFIEAVSDTVRGAWARVLPERHGDAAMVFTAHSIPTALADASPYVAQIADAAQRVAEMVGQPEWSIAYQSRSGNPREPWLEPDIGDAIRQLAAAGRRDVVVVPIGFICDHVEVLYDLDVQARAVAAAAGIGCVRAATVNDHPVFIRMLADVVHSTIAVHGPGAP